MSRPHVNRTRPAAPLRGLVELGDLFAMGLDVPQAQSTEYKRYIFELDPWEIRSTGNVKLQQFTRLNLTIAKTESTNATPVCFFILSYDVQNWYVSWAKLDIHFFDVHEANFLDVNLNSPLRSCGKVSSDVQTYSIDPKFFDTIEGALLVVGASSWTAC